MRKLNRSNVTQAVRAHLKGTRDPLLKQSIASIMRRLRALARDVRLTEQEWAQGIELLTEVGCKNDGKRLAICVGASLSLRGIGFSSDDIDKAAHIAAENQYPNTQSRHEAAVRELLRDAYEGRPPHANHPR